jgi:ABC-type dipeptide/oligopeptide/nickel transport system ATPase component
MALLHRPALLIADEITSALDLLTQQDVLETLREVNRAFGMAILFVSHDLIALRALCSRVAILASGEIIETRPTWDLFRDPREPYTKKLLAALHRFEIEDRQY